MVPLLEEAEALLVLVPVLVLVLELEQLLVDWVTSTSSATTLNSNNSAKWFNKTHRCLSPSFNRLELATHSWPS